MRAARLSTAAGIGGRYRRQVNGHTWGVLAGNSVFLDSYRKRRYTRFLYEKYPQYFIDHHA